MGTLAQLMMESRPDESRRVLRDRRPADPDADDKSALAVVAEGTLAFPFIGNLPQPLSPARVRAAVLDAHRLGVSISGKN